MSLSMETDGCITNIREILEDECRASSDETRSEEDILKDIDTVYDSFKQNFNLSDLYFLFNPDKEKEPIGCEPQFVTDQQLFLLINNNYPKYFLSFIRERVKNKSSPKRIRKSEGISLNPTKRYRGLPIQVGQGGGRPGPPANFKKSIGDFRKSIGKKRNIVRGNQQNEKKNISQINELIIHILSSLARSVINNTSYYYHMSDTINGRSIWEDLEIEDKINKYLEKTGCRDTLVQFNNNDKEEIMGDLILSIQRTNRLDEFLNIYLDELFDYHMALPVDGPYPPSPVGGNTIAFSPSNGIPVAKTITEQEAEKFSMTIKELVSLKVPKESTFKRRIRGQAKSIKKKFSRGRTKKKKKKKKKKSKKSKKTKKKKKSKKEKNIFDLSKIF